MKALIWMLVPLVLLAVPLAFAEEANDSDVMGTSEDNETTDLPEEGNETVEVPEEVEGDPGITPDSPLWGIDVALDRLRLNLAKGPEKANIGLQIAQERLLEIQAMAKKGNSDAVAKAEEKHGEVIGVVEDTVESFDGTAVSNETLKGIEQGMANHIAALEKVRARIQANENLSEEVRTKLLAKIDDLEGKANELVTKVENKKAQIALKKEAKENKTEDLNETDEDLEDNETSEDDEDLEDTGKDKGKDKNETDDEDTDEDSEDEDDSEEE